MYHGDVVPGFPQHPHRGFETVTIVRRGLIDHSDSLGAAARFGAGRRAVADGRQRHRARGDVPARSTASAPNPLELFQIWLNLPARRQDGRAALLDALEPRRSRARVDATPTGATTEVTVVAGAARRRCARPRRRRTRGPRAPTPTWRSGRSGSRRARAWTLPAATPARNRALYFFRGSRARASAGEIRAAHAIALRRRRRGGARGGRRRGASCCSCKGGPSASRSSQHGPFVMNTRAEIQQAFADYQRTQFGGWPWPSDEPVHPRQEGRFARHADGRVERPG